ncbi:MAG: translation initiation factor IF-2 N-terminal domain-containing protein, partial [Acidimicrobiia bacterium]|nr:translation initiation factor IF-2 N-terminal domain-containing protein [Acidimicrobiia bacterium]
MAKKRIYELARELGVESSELLDKAVELGLAVKTASSGLDDSGVELLTMALSGATEPEPEAVEPAAPAEMAAAEPDPAESEPEPEESEEDAGDLRIVSVPAGVSVADFASAIERPVGDVVKALLTRGRPLGAGEFMPEDLMDAVGESFGVIVDREAPAPEAPLHAPRPVFD